MACPDHETKSIRVSSCPTCNQKQGPLPLPFNPLDPLGLFSALAEGSARVFPAKNSRQNQVPGEDCDPFMLCRGGTYGSDNNKRLMCVTPDKKKCCWTCQDPSTYDSKKQQYEAPRDPSQLTDRGTLGSLWTGEPRKKQVFPNIKLTKRPRWKTGASKIPDQKYMWKVDEHTYWDEVSKYYAVDRTYSPEIGSNWLCVDVLGNTQQWMINCGGDSACMRPGERFVSKQGGIPGFVSRGETTHCNRLIGPSYKYGWERKSQEGLRSGIRGTRRWVGTGYRAGTAAAKTPFKKKTYTRIASTTGAKRGWEWTTGKARKAKFW